MGDRSKSSLYSMLLAYLGHRGVDLSSEGVSERGLHIADAFEFIDLLSQNGVRILGVEPWRYEDGKYRIESLGVWASESSDHHSSNAEARQVISLLHLGTQDVVTIQF